MLNPRLVSDSPPDLLQGHLDKVDAERKGGVFAGNLTHVPPGQVRLRALDSTVKYYIGPMATCTHWSDLCDSQ